MPVSFAIELRNVERFWHRLGSERGDLVRRFKNDLEGEARAVPSALRHKTKIKSRSGRLLGAIRAGSAKQVSTGSRSGDPGPFDLGVSIGAGSAEAPHGNMQEWGGSPKSKNGLLAIPIPGTGVVRPRDAKDSFIGRSRAGNLLIMQRTEDGGIRPLFVLLRQVSLKYHAKRPYGRLNLWRTVQSRRGYLKISLARSFTAWIDRVILGAK